MSGVVLADDWSFPQPGGLGTMMSKSRDVEHRAGNSSTELESLAGNRKRR